MPSLMIVRKSITQLFLSLMMLVMRAFGTIFSTVTLAAVFVALVLAAMFVIYGKGLPGHDDLASYNPKTISRIYSGEGNIIDEFATERRLFAAADFQTSFQ